MLTNAALQSALWILGCISNDGNSWNSDISSGMVGIAGTVKYALSYTPFAMYAEITPSYLHNHIQMMWPLSKGIYLDARAQQNRER